MMNQCDIKLNFKNVASIDELAELCSKTPGYLNNDEVRAAMLRLKKRKTDLEAKVNELQRKNTNSQIGIQIQDNTAKNDSQEDRQEQEYSYLLGESLTPAQYRDFQLFAKNNLQSVLFRFPKERKAVRTQTDLNNAIKSVLLNIADTLRVKTIFNPEAIQLPKIQDSDFYNKIGEFVKNLNISEHSPYYISYLLLKHPDTAIKAAIGKYIQIPSGWFDIYDNSKIYSRKSSNDMGSGWSSNDEDLNDMDQVSGLVKLFVEDIPQYLAVSSEGSLENNFILSDRKLDFNSLIAGCNLFQRIIQKEFKSFGGDSIEFEIEDEYYRTSVNQIPIKTNLDLYASIKQNIFTQLPKALEYLFTVDQNLYKHLIATDRRAIEALYSFYKQLVDPNSGYTNEFKSLYLDLLQVLNSTTHQNFNGYSYDEESTSIENHELSSKAADWDALEYSRELRATHSATNQWCSYNINDIKNTPRNVKIPNTNITVNVSFNDELTFSIRSGQQTINWKLSDTISINNHGIKCDISLQDLSTISCIPNTDRFTSIINGSNKHILTALCLDIITRHIANDIMQLDPNVIGNTPHTVYGTRIQNEATFKDVIKTLTSNYEPFTSRKHSFQLDVTNKKSYYSILQPVISLRQIILDKSISTMVETAEHTQLNTQKLSQAGNFVLETAFKHRSDDNNPCSHFMLYDCFRGGSVVRDAKSQSGDVKKAIDFNPEEHFVASFVYDYIKHISKYDKKKDLKVNILGPVDSDKSWIERIKLDLLENININGKQQSLLDVLTSEESTSLLEELICQELGAFYTKQWDFVKSQLTLLQQTAISNKKILQSKFPGLHVGKWFDNGFINFNKTVNTYADLNNYDKVALKQDILHTLVSLNQDINFVENLCGYYKDGELTLNPILQYNLNRYTPNTTESKEWFKKCHDMIISDLIKQDVFIKQNVEDLGVLKERSKNFATDSGLISYATITDGENKIQLTGQKSLEFWKPYQDLVNTARFANRTKQLGLNIYSDDEISLLNSYLFTSPEFSITNLIEFIQSPNFGELVSRYATYKEWDNRQKEALGNDALQGNDKYIEFANKVSKKKKNKYNKPVNYSNISINFNPVIIDHNLLTLLVQEEYLNTTVGTYLNHPIAKGDNLFNQIKNCIGAQIKRNVTLSATKHQYLTGQLDSVPDKIKIAIIQNLSDKVYNLLADGVGRDGSVQKQLSDDGATFVDGAFSYLENKSLRTNAVGQDKKQFGGYVNPKSGTGFILKTAGFAITNDLMRRSPELFNLSKKMRSLKFNPQLLDLLKFNLTSKNIVKAVNTFSNGEVIQKFYKLTTIEKNNTNSSYTIKWVEVLENGEAKLENIDQITEENVIIDDIFTLWDKVLGGMYTCKLVDTGSGQKYTYNNCDLSNELLTEIICTQEGQFLKDYLIAYAPTREAVKQGISNSNSDKVFSDQDYQLTYMEIDTDDLGVQLDAEHSAFENRVALMTQVMNAAAARGYSIQRGDAIYDALYNITQLTIQDCFKAFKQDFDILSPEYTNAMNKISSLVLEVLSKSGISDGNLLDTLSTALHNQFKVDNDFETLRKHIPIDDPLILRQILSKLTSSLQSNAVRLRFPGGQYVLAPSNGYIKLYDGKTLDEYGGQLTDDVKAYLREKSFKNVLGFKDVRMGHAYYYVVPNSTGVATRERIVLDSPLKYWEFRELQESGKVGEIYEDLTHGCDLGCEDFIFTDGDNYYHIWDLYEVRRQWDLITKLKNSVTSEEQLEIKEQLKENQKALQEQLNKLTDPEQDDIINIVSFDESKSVGIRIDRSKNEHVAFEAILPKYLKKRFGLSDFDALSSIKTDREFFYKKVLSKLDSVLSTGHKLNADVCLEGSEFNTYLRYADNIDKISVSEDLEEEIPRVLIRDGIGYLLTDDGQGIKMTIPISNDNKPLIRVFRDKLNNKVIITNNLRHFIDQNKYTHIHLIENRTQSGDDIKTNISQELFNQLKDIEEIKEIFGDEITFEQFSSQVTNYNSNNRKENPILQKLYYNALEQHGALLDSLKFIASRTPAQCHQSFMAMECKAFDHSDRNVAYVSRWQLWLQGSDFDK